jgi:hypothetical protein
MDRSVIERYAGAGKQLRDTLAGVTADVLDRRPADGSWTIREIVIHLADSDLIGADRMKRIIAEDLPMLIGYNETRFIQRLHPELQDVEIAITLFDLNRRQFATVLRALPDDVFGRAGIHNEVGKVTLGDQLRKYIEHFEHHLRFIEKKR